MNQFLPNVFPLRPKWTFWVQPNALHMTRLWSQNHANYTTFLNKYFKNIVVFYKMWYLPFIKKYLLLIKAMWKSPVCLTPCPLQLKSTHQHKSGSVRLRLSSLVQSDFFISHFSSGEPERNLVVVCHNSTTPFFLEHSRRTKKALANGK